MLYLDCHHDPVRLTLTDTRESEKKNLENYKNERGEGELCIDHRGARGTKRTSKRCFKQLHISRKCLHKTHAELDGQFESEETKGNAHTKVSVKA